MTPIRKALLAGLVVCAVGLTGMSVAWACTPSGSIIANPSSGLPGSVIDISGTGFMSPTETSQDQQVGQVEIRWNTTSGPLLATAPGPSFTQPVTVPQNASARTYYFVAVQRRSDGVVVRQGAASFEVTAPQSEPAPAPAPQQQPPAEASAPAPQEAAEGADETAGTPVAAEPTPSATDPGPVEVTEPGRRPGRRATADAASGAARSTRSGGAIAAGPPTDPGLPAEAAPPPPPPPAAPEISPLSVSGDMGAAWQSSISATRGPSLTAPVASPPAGTAGLGLALLAVGSAGLFAGALMGLRSRRRVVTGRSS